ncbi:hypothetical protein ACNKHM_19985 [Shigella sonnei]
MIGQFDDPYGNDHCGFSQSWLVVATHCLCLALINLALATFMPNEYITHLEATPGCWCTLAYRFFPMPR